MSVYIWIIGRRCEEMIFSVIPVPRFREGRVTGIQFFEISHLTNWIPAFKTGVDLAPDRNVCSVHWFDAGSDCRDNNV